MATALVRIVPNRAKPASYSNWISSDFHFLITAVSQSRENHQPGESSFDFWNRVATMFARLGSAHGRPQEIVNIDTTELRRIFYDCMRSARQVSDYEVWRASVGGSVKQWWELDISQRQKFLSGGPILNEHLVVRLLDYFQKYSRSPMAKYRDKDVQDGSSSVDPRALQLQQHTSVSMINPTPVSSNAESPANRPKDIVQPVLVGSNQSTGEIATTDYISEDSAQGPTPPPDVDEQQMAKRRRLDTTSKDTPISRVSNLQSPTITALPLEPGSEVAQVGAGPSTVQPTSAASVTAAQQEVTVPDLVSGSHGVTTTRDPLSASQSLPVEMIRTSSGQSAKCATPTLGSMALKQTGLPPGGLKEAYLDIRRKDFALRHGRQDRLLNRLQNIIKENEIDPDTLGLSLEAWMAYARAVWASAEEHEIHAEEEFVNRLQIEDEESRKKT
ncbi:hypothetical protein POJ06DRAFT_244729 [Lipomyces tetrasporus]|uniref:Uncharacterized protein n=1 Tax=Lipomyces tetrasporus TaxID=54092 RepID=A0AAD7VVR0_9ASCO|nr:uncharacterized protein POJ06DRAFT_244729 [Lipomyces tetrasporus]KAJ8102475.1 hypothetical protein POJ06DRAFT_244729 [Lipomyces tetrasporus]